MNDTRLERWVTMQLRVLDSDGEHVSKAVRFTIERRDGDLLAEFPADLPNLATVIRDALQLQGDELPQGSHQFRVVAYNEQKKQVSELPQTVKGTNRDATAAAHEAIQLQRASSMAIHNMEFAATHLRTEFDLLRQRYDDTVEDRSLLLDTLNELRTANFTQQLELTRFNKTQERLDKMVEAIGGLVTLAAPMLLKKFAPELAGEMSAAVARITAPQPEANPNEQPAPTEPVSATSAELPESRQVAVSQPSQGRRAPNHRDHPRAHRRKPAKPKPTKRK
jgi:hypothetical protein